jgi:hypothetical protein
VIHLYHGTSPHRDLLVACDERNRIDHSLIESVRMS